jgi:hypothetical protein
MGSTGSIAVRVAKCMFDQNTWIWVYILAHDGTVVQSNPMSMSIIPAWIVGGVSVVDKRYYSHSFLSIPSSSRPLSWGATG